MTRKDPSFALVFVTLLIASPAAAQHNHGAQQPAQSPHGGHSGHGTMSTQGMTPASKAFTEANAKMHKDMTIKFSGNADVDFARGMLPHHQGAIEMSDIVLKYGRDPSVKKLANEIIAAQKKEIAQMQAWLQKNGSLAAGPDAAPIASRSRNNGLSAS